MVATIVGYASATNLFFRLGAIILLAPFALLGSSEVQLSVDCLFYYYSLVLTTSLCSYCLLAVSTCQVGALPPFYRSSRQVQQPYPFSLPPLGVGKGLGFYFVAGAC